MCASLQPAPLSFATDPRFLQKRCPNEGKQIRNNKSTPIPDFPGIGAFPLFTTNSAFALLSGGGEAPDALAYAANALRDLRVFCF